MACKPGSVLPCGRGDHSSGMRVTTHLTRPTRTAMRKAPRTVPIWSCSRWGLPSRSCCQDRGALLPHHFNLAAANLPEKTGPVGGVISVALSLGSPPPAVNRHRFSVEPGLSSNPLLRPRSPGHLTAAPYQESAISTMAVACSSSVSNSGTVASAAPTSSGISVQPRTMAWQPCPTRSAITVR